jgi:hypothetical protein
VGGYVEVVRRSGLPLRVLEIGASAGLNLRWDRYWYDTGRHRLGDPASPVRFDGDWGPSPPELRIGPGRPSGTGGPAGSGGPGGVAAGGAVTVVERAGCDRTPLDPTSEEGALALRSYVWPDQVDRHARLAAALAVAAAVPVRLDAADLGEWAERQLAEPVAGVATVVVHSIVWQYVGPEARDRLRGALRRAGAAATPDAPVAWLRMEPSGPVADVRLTWWPGGGEDVLATSGFQGDDVVWTGAAG